MGHSIILKIIEKKIICNKKFKLTFFNKKIRRKEKIGQIGYPI